MQSSIGISFHFFEPQSPEVQNSAYLMELWELKGITPVHKVLHCQSHRVLSICRYYYHYYYYYFYLILLLILPIR